jgi:hypothetical protein
MANKKLNKKDQTVIDFVRGTANAIVQSDPVGENMMYLYDRWRDEKEYEDFKDYEASMKNHVKDFPVKFMYGSKRPFSFTVRIDKLHRWTVIRFVMKANGEFSWKHIENGKLVDLK